MDRFKAILKTVREDIRTCHPIHFEGNGYSEAWREEARARGLDVEQSAPLILDAYVRPKTIEMFQQMHVLSRAELEARLEIKLETYTKKIQIEARIFGDLCMNHIIPVATRYQSQLLENIQRLRDAFPPEEANAMNADNLNLVREISQHSGFITAHVQQLIDARRVANRIEDQRERAIAYHDTVAPLLESIRYHVDKLELIIDDELWPLPKYRELLFIR